MTGQPWGPFVPGMDWPERKAQLRSLRTALRLLTGERGRECGYAIVRAEVAGAPEPELLADAAAAFDRLAPLDRRRVLSSFSAVNYERARA